MTKAYDRVEWLFLGQMMYKMGFSDTFKDLILHCISTISYLVLINRFPSLCFHLDGDLLSLYLFFIYAEGFLAMIRKVETRSDLHGMKTCKQALLVSHLFFTNDSVLFLRASIQESDT